MRVVEGIREADQAFGDRQFAFVMIGSKRRVLWKWIT
jgi:hypothetical protein